MAVLANEAARRGAWLLHYSTDYVFDGSGNSPWCEDAPTAPLNVYGRSKLDGELAIRASGCKHLILRTGWVHSARGASFARSMLRQAAEQTPISVVHDQIGAPTPAELLADVSAHVLRRAMPEPRAGRHLPRSGQRRDQLARLCLPCTCIGAAIGHAVAARNPRPAVEGIRSLVRCCGARPLNCRLDTTKLQRSFALQMPDWRVGVDRLLNELLSPNL